MTEGIGFIGAGNMASAIISGLLRENITLPEKIYIYDISSEKCLYFKQIGITICKDACEVVDCAKYVVIAVKPQNYAEVLSEIRNSVTQDNIFISIAAGISINYINQQLDRNVPVVRVMPNTPMLLGKGASALSRSSNISDKDFLFVKNMFELGGIVEELPENLMNTVISVNGSSPAYIYLFAKAMADYAFENGIPRDKALNLICAAIEGSAAMLRESGDDPDTLIKKVCSPGGTTIEAINTLNSFSFYEAIKKAMENCSKRADELGR